MMPVNTILTGDARAILRTLPSDAVDAVVTSPPYFRLRDYDAAGQIGLERSVDAWVGELRAVFAEVARVLTPAGSLWLNLGDTYSKGPAMGAPRKSLVLAPERLLLALAADGWLVRNKVIWAKSNPLPESVRDRLSTTWEPIYFLTRSPRYHFELDAIRVPHRGRTRAAVEPNRRYGGGHSGLTRLKAAGRYGHPRGKNPGDVWRLSKGGYRGAHFATFPPALIERPILATVPERVCTGGGRVRRGIVLDPFFGTGTVGAVATRLGRDWLGIEVNRAFVPLAMERITAAGGSVRVVDGCTVGGRVRRPFCLPPQPSTTRRDGP